MPDPATTKALLLIAAWLCCVCGLAWLALTLDAHWQQVKGTAAAAGRTLAVLRLLGAGALAVALLICFRADHPTMAPLVWLMMIAGAALLVAFTLSWRPRWLAPLVAWPGAAAQPAQRR